MKFSVTKREILTKAIISAMLLMIMVLSFFFSEKLESFFGMNLRFAKNEVDEATLSASSYTVDYIDVGQGNSSFIKFPDGKTMLVDGGDVMFGKTIEEHLSKYNVTQIDYLIATHADSDHIGGLNHILEKYEIKNIYRPFQISGTGTNYETFVPSEYEDLAEVYYHYKNLSKQNKVSRVESGVYETFIKNIYSETYTDDGSEVSSLVTVFYDGLKIEGTGYNVEFFAPLIRDQSVDVSEYCDETVGFATKGYGVGNSNDNSAVFLVTIGTEKFLYTGDASWKEGSTEEYKFGKHEELDFVNSLTSAEKSRLSNVSVYLAGHHGSSNSSSKLLLDLINPSFVVFSVGLNNNYGHPSSEVVFRIEKTTGIEPDYLLRTDEVGTICFGENKSKLVYAKEISATNESMKLTWNVFAIVVFPSLILLVIFIKPIRRKVRK